MSGPISLETLIVRGEDLVFAEVGGEAVALSVESGVCFGLNSVGLRVLEIIESPMRVADVCAQLEAEYAVDAQTCQTDVIQLLTELDAEGLVAIEPPSPAG